MSWRIIKLDTKSISKLSLLYLFYYPLLPVLVAAVVAVSLQKLPHNVDVRQLLSGSLNI